ncbi:ARM-repeat/Tetratricopeptide repeat (TPR)-like protein [Wolffia australiana]
MAEIRSREADRGGGEEAEDANMRVESCSSDCQQPGCFFCVMKETNPRKRTASIRKFFRELPSQDNDGQVLPISGLWNAAMSRPNDPELIDLGIFPCMASLIWKGLKNRRWLSHDQNIFIPYYAAHIIGSYTMHVEDFADAAVLAGVVPPLVELLRGRLTWVEQRVAVRALGHLTAYPSTFLAVSRHEDVLELAIQLALNSLDIVYTQFYEHPDSRLGYHCDLLTRGVGGREMESSKAEEWASQLQCWSLQLINCFAFKPEFLPAICRPEFLVELPGMWGGLVNDSSPAGIGLLRTICRHKLGRANVSGHLSLIEALGNVARSSDDWQFMAIDCLLSLFSDPNSCCKVASRVLPVLADLAETPTMRDTILCVLEESRQVGEFLIVEEVLSCKQRRREEKRMGREELRVHQAAALVVKLEGNSLFSAGNIAGAMAKYTEALNLCPSRSRKERVVLYSNRAQCHLLLQQPQAAVSNATRALCLHRPVGRHGRSLWRRAQAYDMLGQAKESLLDAILFINECSQSEDPDNCSFGKQSRVPNYAERLVRKQMHAAWLFREAALRHGSDKEDRLHQYPHHLEVADDSEWETASENDIAFDNGDAKRYDAGSMLQ